MQSGDQASHDQFRRYLVDAARYWEKRRLIYNLLLSAIVIAWFSLTWPHFRAALNMHSLALLAVLALLANACYSAAYLLDIPIQYSLFRNHWCRRRWVLWLIGAMLATVITNYWIADEIYPYVNQ